MIIRKILIFPFFNAFILWGSFVGTISSVKEQELKDILKC